MRAPFLDDLLLQCLTACNEDTIPQTRHILGLQNTSKRWCQIDVGDVKSPDEEGNVVKHQISRRANKCYTDTPAPELLQDRDVKPVAGELEPSRLGRPASSEQLLESHHGLDSIFMRELTAFGRTGCAACVETVACGLWIYRDYIDWRSRVIIKGARVKCDNRRRCIIFLRLHELIGE